VVNSVVWLHILLLGPYWCMYVECFGIRLKLQLLNQLKYIDVVNSVVWLHILLLGPYWCMYVCGMFRNQTKVTIVKIN